MACPLYLAMTAAEFHTASVLPPSPAWMACHFSPYGRGLSNLPRGLPQGSMLMVNDRIPVEDHDPELIASQLAQVVADTSAGRVLLDFQREGCSRTQEITDAIVEKLSCPVGVSIPYRRENAAVFLPPVPAEETVQECLAAWSGWEIWLETAPQSACITVTESGSEISSCDRELDAPEHFDGELCCHYKIEVSPGQVQFLLQRTKEDALLMCKNAEALGVTCAVGLFQELF